MAMSVGGDSTDKPMSDINTTPLVDVMLVLLIIFLIAVPVVIQQVKGIKLPNVRFDPTTTKPENVSLTVSGNNGQCQVYWGVAPVTHGALLDRAVTKLKADVARLGSNITPDDLPEAHIRADVNTPYHCVGATIYTMQAAGFSKVGFISEPPAGEGIERL